MQSCVFIYEKLTKDAFFGMQGGYCSFFIDSCLKMSGLTELFVSLPQIYNKKSMSYNLLKGKRGIVFGALNEQSIAWKVAEKAVEEGAVITFSNTPVAVRKL